MDLKELEKLSKLCQKYGIRHYQSAQLTLDFDHKDIPNKTNLVQEEKPFEEAMSEEDVLFWSTQPQG